MLRFILNCYTSTPTRMVSFSWFFLLIQRCLRAWLPRGSHGYAVFVQDLLLSFWWFVSISRSLCRSLLRMYQWASTMFLRTLFWNLWMMLMLLALAQSQSWPPYVQTGLSICWYEFLPIIQYSFVYLMPNPCLLFLTWTFQRSLASKVMPKYFADVA